MKHLVLVGSGHSQLFVLKKLTTLKPNLLKVTLITPSRWQEYSGMLPGWLTGRYKEEECRIDLWPFIKRANIHFIEGSITGMDAAKRCVFLSDGTAIPYDFLSLDVGSESDVEWLQALENKLIPLRPIAEFRAAWLDILGECHNDTNFKLAIVGGGAAGVEVALATAKTLYELNSRCQIFLVAGIRGVLPDHCPRAQRAALNALTKAKVDVINGRAAGTSNSLLMSNGRTLNVNRVIAATGSKPAVWLKLSQLELDSDGYVVVDAHHRSVSHPNVFAAGNVCSRSDVNLQKSGVHAVHAGPVLAHNLLASFARQPLKTYRPKKRSLYLLSCSNGQVIISWGKWCTEGRLAWYLKDALDRHYIRNFSHNTGLQT